MKSPVWNKTQPYKPSSWCNLWWIYHPQIVSSSKSAKLWRKSNRIEWNVNQMLLRIKNIVLKSTDNPKCYLPFTKIYRAHLLYSSSETVCIVEKKINHSFCQNIIITTIILLVCNNSLSLSSSKVIKSNKLTEIIWELFYNMGS